jgi:CheY-like chemotaxis protein
VPGALGESTENVSQSGLFVRTERTFENGAAVQLRLSFPGLLEPFDVDGVVRWTRREAPDLPAGVGVELSPQGKRRLALFHEALKRDPEPGRTFRVLLAEDNQHVADLYRFALKRLKNVAMELEHARDGHEALRSVFRQRPDLLLLDLVMPVLDGVEVLRRLRASPEHRTLPVVVISAADRQVRLAAEEAGADVILRKPVRSSDVVDTVRALLALRG